jgi:hypothetical protein
MSDRPTPETDDQPTINAVNDNGYQIPCVDIEFARKLERERDEAREEQDKAKTELEMWRDGNILHEIHRNELEKAERERDEAREKAERYRLEANAIMLQRDEAISKL